MKYTNINSKSVFAFDINNHSRKMYEANFSRIPKGDIELVQVNKIPNHDILFVGFLCHSFSPAGKKKGFNNPQKK